MELITRKNRLKNIVDGMKMLYLPVFYNRPYEEKVKPYKTESDAEKLKSDYRKSTKEISRGIREFEQLHRK